jgi:HEAT repeat protein
MNEKERVNTTTEKRLRTAATQRLDRLGVTNAHELLALMRDGKEPRGRRAEAAYVLSWQQAFKSLSRRQRREAVRAATDAFVEDDPRLSWGAAHLLVTAKNSRTWKLLSSVATSQLHERTRLNAVYGLMMLGDSRAAPTLAGLLADHRQSPRLRGQSAEALGTCCSQSKRVLVALVTALQDKSPEVRLFSANALASCGRQSAIPALRRLLSDHHHVRPYGVVSREAAYAIKTITLRSQE